MKLKAIIILALVVVGSFTAKAQVPGYMGRKFMLTAAASPVIQIYTSYNGKFAVRPRLGLVGEYAITRNRTLGVKYAYYGRKSNVYAYYSDTDGWGDPYVTYDETIPCQTSVNSITFRTLKYRSGNLPAPLGVYTGWGLGLSIASVHDKFGVLVHKDGSQKKGTYATTITPDVHYYFGVRRGIGNSMLWSITTDFNLAYLGYLVANETDNGNYDDTPPAGVDPAGFKQHDVTKDIARDVAYRSSLINITLEFTFLPF